MASRVRSSPATGVDRGQLAVAESGAMLQSSPPRAGRTKAGHPFDLRFALGERVDAPEAHTYLRVVTELEQAGRDRAVAATPTAWLRPLHLVAADSSSRHDDTSSTDVVRHPMRMLLPLGSVSVNSCMPHGVSSTCVTGRPAVTSWACQSSTSRVMM